jgi:hypothetical protein
MNFEFMIISGDDKQLAYEKYLITNQFMSGIIILQ